MKEAAPAAATLTRRPTSRGLPLFPDEPLTLPQIFLKAAELRYRADALNFKRDGIWQSISTGDMLTRVGNIALGLQSIGVKSGEKAAILSANSPEWTLADAGCQFAGVVDVPIYTTLAPKTIAFILNDSETKVFFVQDKAAYDRIAGDISECSALQKLIFFDADGIDLTSEMMSLAVLEKAGAAKRADEPGLLEELCSSAVPDDLATLIYTSGTTGEPKGVMLTHANIVSNVIDAGEKYLFSRDDVPLSVLPLSHIFERSAMYLYIYNGMCVHYAEGVDRVPDNLREVRPTIFVGVPRIFEKVYASAKLKAARSGGMKEKIFDWAIATAKEFALQKESGDPISSALSLKHIAADRLVYKKLREFFGGRLRCCITGGAALSDDIYLIFTGAGIPIMQGYGLTETSPVISSSNPAEVRLGCVGKPIRNFKVRIAEDGEVEAQGPGVMAGYFNNPSATAEAFTPDGWFRTGDIGSIDTDGFLRITDRKKELFKTSAGKYIAPSPIEQMIRTSRFVSQAVLVGNERNYATALIVPNFDMLSSYARLKGMDVSTPAEFCASDRIHDLIERQVTEATSGLARHETVKKIALLENEMTVEGGELTPTLKVKRRVVDQKYKAVIDAMYREK